MFYKLAISLIGALMFSAMVSAKEMDIKFATNDGVHLHGKIFHPDGKKKFPAVLAIEGSGKSHFTDDIASSPFFQLGRELSQKGFVYLTYSKRGSAANSKNGSWAKSSFWIDNKDAQAALEYLKNQPNVDPNQIFIFGQSVGCLHASLLSQKNNVKGTVLFAGGYQNFLNILKEQNTEILSLMGKKDEEINKELAPMLKACAEIKAGRFNCSDYKDMCTIEDGASVLDGIQEVYLSEILKIEPLDELKKISNVTLVLQGTADFVISPNEFERAKKALATEKNFSFVLLPGVDHVMAEHKDIAESLKAMSSIQKTKTFSPISPKFLETVSNWLVNRTRN